MLLSGNVSIFQWYFTRASVFNGILQKTSSFDAAELIFPYFIYCADEPVGDLEDQQVKWDGGKNKADQYCSTSKIHEGSSVTWTRVRVSVSDSGAGVRFVRIFWDTANNTWNPTRVSESDMGAGYPTRQKN